MCVGEGGGIYMVCVGRTGDDTVWGKIWWGRGMTRCDGVGAVSLCRPRRGKRFKGVESEGGVARGETCGRAYALMHPCDALAQRVYGT